MEDPVIAQDGRTYDRANIQRWMNCRPERVTSPITNVPLESRELYPNHDIKSAIVTFVEKWGKAMNSRRGKMSGISGRRASGSARGRGGRSGAAPAPPSPGLSLPSDLSDIDVSEAELSD